MGSYVLNGILEQLYAEATRQLDDRVILRPFPIAISDAAERNDDGQLIAKTCLTRRRGAVPVWQ